MKNVSVKNVRLTAGTGGTNNIASALLQLWGVVTLQQFYSDPLTVLKAKCNSEPESLILMWDKL